MLKLEHIQLDEPFIESRRGILILAPSTLVTILWFLILADRAEQVFGSDNPPGITIGHNWAVSPLDSPGNWWPMEFMIGSFGALLLTVATILLTRYLVKKYNMNIFPLVVTITIVYFVLFYSMAHLNTFFHVSGRTAFSLNPIPDIILFLHSTTIGLQLGCYTQPLVPGFLANHKDVSKYIDNQWRYAQTVLSLGIAGVVGSSLPFVFELSNDVNVIAFTSTVATLLVPVISIVSFFLLRLYAIEWTGRDFRNLNLPL
jgi:hypothetical protein